MRRASSVLFAATCLVSAALADEGQEPRISKQPPIGPPGHTAHYHFAKEMVPLGSVVKSFTFSLGPTEIRGDKPHQWLSLEATKANGERFHLWLLTARFSSPLKAVLFEILIEQTILPGASTLTPQPQSARRRHHAGDGADVAPAQK